MVELLTGNWRSDHLFNLKQHMAMYDTIPVFTAVNTAESTINARNGSIKSNARAGRPNRG